MMMTWDDNGLASQTPTGNGQTGSTGTGFCYPARAMPSLRTGASGGKLVVSWLLAFVLFRLSQKKDSSVGKPSPSPSGDSSAAWCCDS